MISLIQKRVRYQSDAGWVYFLFRVKRSGLDCVSRLYGEGKIRPASGDKRPIHENAAVHDFSLKWTRDVT